MDKGYIHVYTGNGKGKTTAAFGLALRASCTGKKVFIGQFVKGMKYSEVKIGDYLPNIEIHQFGDTCFIDRHPNEDDINLAREGLKKCKDVLNSGKFDVVILDEINIALYFKLFSVEEVIKILKDKAENVEAVLTGRYAPKEIIEIADLVTEMKEIKHYFTKGVMSREGIDC